MFGEEDKFSQLAIEYLDLHSLYDILEMNGVTQEEVVAYLLRTSFIGLPPYLDYDYEEEDNE